MPYYVGDTKTYDIKLTLDGAPWSPTSATFYLQRPDGSVFSAAGTISPSGLPTYSDSPSNLTLKGVYLRWWVVVQGSINETTPAVAFQVDQAGT